MSRFALKIKQEIENSGSIKNTLKMNEKKLKEYINNMKKEIFRDKIGTIS
jgi:hypothetical protein